VVVGRGVDQERDEGQNQKYSGFRKKPIICELLEYQLLKKECLFGGFV
jgi:hypothetical protein